MVLIGVQWPGLKFSGNQQAFQDSQVQKKWDQETTRSAINGEILFKRKILLRIGVDQS